MSINLEKSEEIRVQTVTVAADTQTDEKQLKILLMQTASIG